MQNMRQSQMREQHQELSLIWTEKFAENIEK